MLKQRHDFGQRDIQVDSKSICQRWFIDKTQGWNNVDFALTPKTILFSYLDTWKVKVFVLTLKR